MTHKLTDASVQKVGKGTRHQTCDASHSGFLKDQNLTQVFIPMNTVVTNTFIELLNGFQEEELKRLIDKKKSDTFSDDQININSDYCFGFK